MKSISKLKHKLVMKIPYSLPIIELSCSCMVSYTYKEEKQQQLLFDSPNQQKGQKASNNVFLSKNLIT